MKLFYLLTLFILNVKSEQLYTIYADGSYQYYDLEHCYRCFFPYPYTNEEGKSGTIKSYILYHHIDQSKNDNYYYEILYFNEDCSNEAMIKRITVGTNCKDCDYNMTSEDTVGDTFASLVFSPIEEGSCASTERYVRNYYPNNIFDKCVNGIVGGYEMSFLQKVEKRNGIDVIERKRLMGKTCDGSLMETVTAECGKCVEIRCEINAFAQVGCKEISASSYLNIGLLLLICLLLF